MTKAYRWLRVAAICRALHVLPRSGGVLEQPNDELRYLEKMLDAYARYEERNARRDRARHSNRVKHAPKPEGALDL